MQNETNYTTMKNIEESISKVAQATATTLLSYNGSIDLHKLLSAEIAFNALDMEISFENEAAQSNFKTLVKYRMHAHHREAYEKVFVPTYMDQNGNYTTDSSKWA